MRVLLIKSDLNASFLSAVAALPDRLATEWLILPCSHKLTCDAPDPGSLTAGRKKESKLQIFSELAELSVCSMLYQLREVAYALPPEEAGVLRFRNRDSHSTICPVLCLMHLRSMKKLKYLLGNVSC